MNRSALFWLLAIYVASIAPPGQAAPCEDSYEAVFAEVAPSVVGILSVAIDPFSLAERVKIRSGSGVVIGEVGHVLTNAHIVFEASEIMISVDDEIHEAELVGIDPISDLAVVTFVDPSIRLKSATLGASEKLQIGERVLAIGYPLGLGKTATQGIVSGIGRSLPFTTMSWLTPLIQTDATVNPGNSGGPLVNLCGEVVAINTLASERGQNTNFAIPISLARDLASELVEHGRVIRPWHGIHGRIVPPALMFVLDLAPGFLIETVEPGSPAEQIGLRGGSLPLAIGVDEFLLGGDVITRVNGEPLSDMDTVVRIATSVEVGDVLTIEYLRDGVSLSAEVTLPERPTLPGDVQRFRNRGP